MREIKFRGLRESKQWVFGLLEHHPKDTLNYKAGWYIINNGFLPTKIKVDPDTIGQYVEIIDAYEGDVLFGSESDEHGGISTWMGVVEYNEEMGRIMIKGDWHRDDYDWYEVDDFDFEKIIDNIHTPAPSMAPGEVSVLGFGSSDIDNYMF